jgi:cAMP phosphodiesterase
MKSPIVEFITPD